MKGVLAKEKATFSIEVDIEISPSTIDKVNHQIQELDDREQKAFVREKYLRYHIGIAIVPKTGALYVTDEHVIALDVQGQPLRDKAHTFLVWDGNQRFMEGQKIARFSTLRDRSFLLPDLVPRESLYVCRKHRGQTMIESFSLWEIPDVDVDEEPSISDPEKLWASF